MLLSCKTILEAKPIPAGIVRGVCLAAMVQAALAAGVAHAQNQTGDRFYPLDQNASPGAVAHFSSVAHPDTVGYYQPVRVELPSTGTVTIFSRTPGAATPQPAPAEAAVLIGPLYRLQISHMPEFPGVELYPTVELLDRLHPPAGRAAHFPVPLVFTVEDIELALEGRLISRVVYLEQPDRADPFRLPGSAPGQFIGSTENAIAWADQAGRPMALVRLGGRVPDLSDPEPGFFGAGAPVLLRRRPAPVPQTPDRPATPLESAQRTRRAP